MGELVLWIVSVKERHEISLDSNQKTDRKKAVDTDRKKKEQRDWPKYS